MKKWFARIYGLNDQLLHSDRYDLVIAISYGILHQDRLPDAAIKTLGMAFKIALIHRSAIAWANASYFWPGCQEQENKLKLERARRLELTPIVASKGATNSVTEAKHIREALLKDGIELQSKTIVLVVDWPHGRSARIIWEKLFPEATIVVKSIDGNWNENHPMFFGRGKIRWILLNLFRHLLLSVFNLQTVSRLQHPIIK